MTSRTGFGRTRRSHCEVTSVRSRELGRAVTTAGARGVLASGAGCSYGDAGLNTGGQLLELAAGPHEVVLSDGRLTAPASATFEDLLRVCVPRGWLVPVLPGTRHLTLGGAIAADVHGKNHVHDGSLASWLDQVVLVDGTGAERVLLPGTDAFRATVGGMGLTGVVVSATVRLVPLPGDQVDVTTERCRDLDSVLCRLDRTASEHPWSVAWVDGLAGGRGIISSARLAGTASRSYRAAARLTAPASPVSVVNPVTARGFNELWWRVAGREGTAQVDLTRYFHPLDGVRAWNRLYGPRGFLQYQFVVPDPAVELVGRALHQLRKAGCTPFLGVLKRFGPGNDGHLSFPRAGWSLAVDLPQSPGTAGVLDRLDRSVAEAGGAVYLAKDDRLSPDLVEAMYPRLPEWRAVQRELDPQGRFRSDLDRRLGLVRRA